MFNIGDTIFYPMHGAGFIEAIEEKEILGEQKLYYILKIPHINVQIMIPQDKAACSGLRYVVEPDILENALEHLYEGTTDPDIFENNRFCLSTNKNKIKSGDIYQVTEIIRDLMRKSKKIKLGTEDRNMLDSARQILLSELIQVKGLDDEEAGVLLDQVIQKEELLLVSEG